MSRKIQLSLFPKSITEQILIQRAAGNTIEIYIECPCCGIKEHVPHHVPVHSFEYMRKKWTELKPNTFYVSAKCGYKCKKKQ